MTDVISAGLLTIGALLLLLAAIGLTRLPDLFTRMQAATKASTLGIGCMLLAVAVYFQDFAVTIRAGLVIVFVFITAPVAAHMIGRAAYIVGVPLWEGSIVDELQGHYPYPTQTLQRPSSAPLPEPAADASCARPAPEPPV